MHKAVSPSQPLSLFPAMASIDAVVDLAISQTPQDQRNQVLTLLGTYHNTLLYQLQHSKPSHGNRSQKPH